MLSHKFYALFFALSACALPVRREVPQEHSHEPFLTSVGNSLDVNNPDQITDPVFALLGDAAAAQGAGNVTNLDCLQQIVADQAFTNAKAAGDVQGQVDALVFRTLERNSASVGATTAQCTGVQATNPEIAALQQHQDPASPNATAVNKAIELELAKQIASVGGNPQDALKSGTFAPGQIGDPTAKGNTCDDANDPNGCIFTQNLLVPAATADEISAAVGGTTSANGTTVSNSTSTNVDTSGSSDNSTNVSSLGAATSAAVIASAIPTAAGSAVTAASGGKNLQTFTGALGGVSAPAVTAGGKGFVVQGSDSFLNLAAALGRSCDIQHNQCADAANSNTNSGSASGLTVSQCDQQDTQCEAAGSS
ncbi:hypothetical protein SERLADRAFT_449918 [Serpula lacrymans var. lacrymans S7.9]|uniref:Uncharacterized protein n=1 Tax=Serpula lacrymans var. lacrymans (strain S7.9) TaxID=578457 RepID=F8NY95_SERL9|nr:uncharacterized protein SERLADRAFT_449918 [Serpula lacrymans var. lacrymans S7.9]EGO23567.1 hypothetical protein SERLADRAFT_449918 [Serpula lacrymans var. lacrymans S7.9]